MIECVKGPVIYTGSDGITVEAGSVGYFIHCPNPFVYRSEQASVTVYTYQHVREDAIRLYGFPTREERQIFEQLLGVSGIGPKGALAILASGRPEQVVNAIEQEQESFLVKFPGVGKKTARQMILDLKGKLAPFAGLAGYAEGGPLFESEPAGNEALEEALEALKALGYGEKEVEKIKPKLEVESLTTDEYVRKGLAFMLNV
ncbi:Holliday junction DNA helicase subunit RuvA [Salsuginibacillus halophilus]|uniref:Holliday junction branch migration complex subunit RuvA n=1 Tax=Salsuginibacillus halophilus TaxID=517424 RepID=A0A2P8HFY3_9BACI|nr:Holliday junction branch migration protein RuvA [Salsuginibacillus halophilus]PSL45125.1 Holliday junction DNA helicase subunit RuvA [Salsuginibacillus halophilus]